MLQLRATAVSLTGKLRKQSPSFPYRWQTRFCEFLGSIRGSTHIGILVYWPTEAGRLKRARPRGSIVIFGVQRAEQLGLVFLAEGGRRVKTRAESAIDRERWYLELSNFLAGLPADSVTPHKLQPRDSRSAGSAEKQRALPRKAGELERTPNDTGYSSGGTYSPSSTASSTPMGSPRQMGQMGAPQLTPQPFPQPSSRSSPRPTGSASVTFAGSAAPHFYREAHPPSRVGGSANMPPKRSSVPVPNTQSRVSLPVSSSSARASASANGFAANGLTTLELVRREAASKEASPLSTLRSGSNLPPHGAAASRGATAVAGAAAVGQISTAEVIERVFRGCASAPTALSDAALKWLSRFVSGVEAFTVHRSFAAHDELVLEFADSRRAEIATRSRVPVAFELERVVRIRPIVTGETVSFEVDGLSIGPVEGARQLWKALLPEWQRAGISKWTMDSADLDARAELAWSWWLKHKDEYADTKVWRIIESLAGLRTASLVPRQGFQDLLMGIICVTRTRARALTFSFFEGKKGDQVQVACEADDDPAVFDAQSEDYDPDAGWKRPASAAIAWRNVEETSKRDLAEKFARSGINFSLLFAGREQMAEHGVRGASVDAICKLFQASEAIGGAKAIDVTLGALKWQKEDPTFRMTGDHGRIMWVPRT